MTDATADTVVEAPATPWDVMITLTEVEGNLTFEGRMNPDKAPDDVATSALAFTNFLADQLPMLVQMASASTQIKQSAPAESTALIDSGFAPTGTPRQIVGLVGEAINSTDASVEAT